MLIKCIIPVLLINSSPYPWNKIDMLNLKQAKKRCAEMYPKSPCVKAFTKTDKNSYRVICNSQK